MGKRNSTKQKPWRIYYNGDGTFRLYRLIDPKSADTEINRHYSGGKIVNSEVAVETRNILNEIFVEEC